MAESDEKPKAGPRYYLPDRNPDGAAIPGIALRDFPASEFRALPLWMQRSIDAAPFYSRDDPAAPAAAPESKPADAPPVAPAAPGGSAATMPGPQGVVVLDSTAGSNAVPAPAAPAKES